MAEEDQRGGSDAQHSHPAKSSGDKRLQDNLSPEERSRIGQKGGETVAREKGPEFFSEIGQKGGEARGEQGGSSGGQRGGSSGQHAKAGSQSHKDD